MDHVLLVGFEKDIDAVTRSPCEMFNEWDGFGVCGV